MADRSLVPAIAVREQASQRKITQMLQSIQTRRAADLDRMLRDIEHRLSRLSRAASRSAPSAVDRVSDTIVSALNDVTDRLRGPARATMTEAVEFGDEALRLGNDTLRKLGREAQQRPLLLLAVAVGVGALAIGLLSRR
ncbi:MAG: hypothetical protein E6G97_25575 [Alphaproteobacteria bacterium]|nr:MAG: hypothetical protein E6G97_25575 [Alphaproteobacteria bacterium]